MPVYDLEEIRQAALAYKIDYQERKVQRHIANLGYQLRDVAQCFANCEKVILAKVIY